METVSVSKGVFVFNEGFQVRKKSKGHKKCTNLTQENPFSSQLWYKAYKTLWNDIENKIQNLNTEMFSSVLKNLILFVNLAYQNTVLEVPSAALLTGINMPDHEIQFSTLSKELKTQITPHVAILHAQDCSSLKLLVENMIDQLINQHIKEESENDSDEDKKCVKIVKKSQCSFDVLKTWYESTSCGKRRGKEVIALIFPEFESFNSRVLQDFILIASSYINILPFVLIFGVATSLTALNKSLPHHVSSKVNIQVFNSQSSTAYLNNVLENVFLSNNCPFHLGGSLFALFTDIFLFYDFSVTGFIQNFKYAMLEHFSRGKPFALCANLENIGKNLLYFKEADLEDVRRSCPSFRRHVESQQDASHQIALLEDDVHFVEDLQDCLIELTNYINKLHVFLKCLQILVDDLPKAPLGKQIRELYILATSSNITSLSEYKESFQLLGFLSKGQLLLKLLAIIGVLSENVDENISEYCRNVRDCLNVWVTDLKCGTEIFEDEADEFENCAQEMKNLDRKQLKLQLLQGARNTNRKRIMNKYEKDRCKILKYLEGIFRDNLKEPTNFAYHELFFFNDMSIQSYIIGSHRAAIHTALNDPHSYLQCLCCKLNNEASILNTMPDICIAYKLHLEYGKIINVYDWLQAFLSILDPISGEPNEDTREVDPQLQARFTQCVAELEYLGFIKNSKRKADHVTRLTWGG